MIPNNFLGVADSAIADRTDSSSSNDFFSPLPRGDGDFSNAISQAIERPYSKPVDAFKERVKLPYVPSPSPQSTSLTSTNYDQTSAKVSDRSDSDSDDESSDDDQLNSKDRQNQSSDINPVLAGNLAALLALTNTSPAVPQKLVPASQGKGGDLLTQVPTTSVPATLSGRTSNEPAAKPTAATQSGPSDSSTQPQSSEADAPNPLAALLQPVSSTAQDASGASASPLTQAIEAQTIANQENSANPAVSAGGISSALHTKRMKFAGQENENAGRTVQKLPRAGKIDRLSTVSTDSADSAPAKLPAGDGSLEGKAQFSNLPLSADLSPKTGLDTVSGKFVLEAKAPDQAAIQVERVSQLVGREAVMIRQSGAISLAVSLKVDPQTELFVQLTNHDGQVQASLRFERGNLAGLDTHWGQLQESLSRQNVQLLPLDDRSSGRNSSANSAFNSSSGHSDQPAQNQQSQNRTPRAEALSADSVAKPARQRGAKTKNSGPSGWESWA